MNIILIKPWGLYSKGATFSDMPRGQSQILIDRGIAAIEPTEPRSAQANHSAMRLKLRRNK